MENELECDGYAVLPLEPCIHGMSRCDAGLGSAPRTSGASSSLVRAAVLARWGRDPREAERTGATGMLPRKAPRSRLPWRPWKKTRRSRAHSPSVSDTYEHFYWQHERLQSQNHGVNNANSVNTVQIKPFQQPYPFFR